MGSVKQRSGLTPPLPRNAQKDTFWLQMKTIQDSFPRQNVWLEKIIIVCCRKECLLLTRSLGKPAHVLTARNPLSQATESLGLLEFYARPHTGLEVSSSERRAPSQQYAKL